MQIKLRPEGDKARVTGLVTALLPRCQSSGELIMVGRHLGSELLGPPLVSVLPGKTRLDRPKEAVDLYPVSLCKALPEHRFQL